MAWSIFSNGGDAAAVEFGRDLLVLLEAPVNTSTLTFMYQWQHSEGGGGKWSPMNCGPLTKAQCAAWGLPFPVDSLTGEQYGGGAADYASRVDGLHATADYLHMSNYSAVLAALRSGDGTAARHALINSPWAASHYGNGTNWSMVNLPAGTQTAHVAKSHGKPPNGLVHPVWWTQPTDGNAVGWRSSDRLPDNAQGVETPDGHLMHKVINKGWVRA